MPTDAPAPVEKLARRPHEGEGRTLVRTSAPVEFEAAWVILAGGVVVALIALGALARGALEARARRRRLTTQMARAQRGERAAEALLEAAGWSVVGQQVQGSYELWVGGRARAIGVRADYMVEAGGRRFVAEVKTGRRAVDVGHPATRRQLLEYRVAFEVEGVLLVDAEAGTVDEVRFPWPGAGGPAASGGGRRGPDGLFWLLAGLAAGAGAALAFGGDFFSN